ncbi:MAG: hypothetical protein ACE5J7_04695 [Candidatus Aenigmatarchaeota archaeon]
MVIVPCKENPDGSVTHYFPGKKKFEDMDDVADYSKTIAITVKDGEEIKREELDVPFYKFSEVK